MSDAQKTGLRQVNERDRELMRMDSIASQMPIHFSSGLQIEEFTGCCFRCGVKFTGGDLHGKVATGFGVEVATIEAAGVCPSCNVLTIFASRIYADGRFTSLLGHKWVTRQIEMSKTRPHGWLQKMSCWLKARVRKVRKNDRV